LLFALDDIGVIENRDRTNLVDTVLSTWVRTNYPLVWEKHFPELAAKRKQYMVDYQDPTVK
jgi:hypothetical protein